MLQSIREHTQGWIAGIIISVIILTFALWGIHSYFVGGGNRAVASVNGVDISRDQLAVSYERLRRQVQMQQGSAAAGDEVTLKEQALQSLIDVEVLKQSSIKEGFFVSSQQVDGYLQSMPEFQVDGQFSVEKFNQILSSSLMTAGDFLDVIKTGLLVDQPRLGVILTSFALPDEASVSVALVNQERDIDYIEIPRSAFASDVSGVSEGDIDKYYREHRDEFMTPEKASVDYVELSVKDLYSKFKPTEAELKNYYTDNVSSYTEPTAWKLSGILIPVSESATKDQAKEAEDKANELYQKIKSGEDFAAIAKKHPGNVINKGEFTTLNQVPAQLQTEVVELKEKGEVTSPIKTSEGYVIVKAIDIRPPQVQTFAEVHQKVKDGYVHQKAEEKYAEMRERLADLTYEHPESLSAASKALNLPIKTTGLFTKDSGDEGVTQSKKVRDLAFSNDVLNLQNNSDVIQMSPEDVIVLRVNQHIPSTLLPLSEVSGQIKQTLSQAGEDQSAEKFANDLIVKMNAGDVNPAVLTSKNFKWVSKGYLGRYSTQVDTAILDQAFRLPRPDFVKKKTVYGIAKMPEGYALVAVKGVKDGTRNRAQMDVFTEQLQNSQGILEYELYKKSQLDHAKISKTDLQG